MPRLRADRADPQASAGVLAVDAPGLDGMVAKNEAGRRGAGVLRGVARSGRALRAAVPTGPEGPGIDIRPGCRPAIPGWRGNAAPEASHGE